MTKTVFDRFERPPAADLLGWRLISLDAEAGIIEIAFEGKREFTNPMGYVQGGILTAMLDDTLGPAIVGMTGGKRFGQTIDLHTHFIRPVRPGPIRCMGRVTRLGANIAYMEGQLFDRDGKLAARATASAYLVELK